MKTAKERIVDFLDAAGDLAVELERELCKRPAVSPEFGGEGEFDKCEFLGEWLKKRGIICLERYGAPDSRAKGGVRPSLIATLHGEAPEGEGRLWIMSHLDVVPPGEASLWKSDPWELVYHAGGSTAEGAELGPHIIGRGVEDNQQGLTSSVLAALALSEAGIKPRRTIKLLFAADEENGNAYGVGWLIRNVQGLFQKNDMVLIPDGGDRDGASIEVAEKNLLWVTFRTRGRQAHGSRPDLGVNASLAGSLLAVKLHEGLKQKFSGRDPLFEPDYSTFEVTKKEANVPNINTIPAEDVFSMDMRVLPRYPLVDVLAEIDRIKAEVEAACGVSISYSASQRLESKPTSPDAPLVKALAEKIEEVYHKKARLIGIGGGTVGAFLRNEGIDSAVWCRIDETAHQPNEYALLANILGDAKVMTLLMLEL